MRFGDLTYLEIRECVAAGALALVPTGCTEQQGPHLPVDFDTWHASEVCVAGADYALARFGVQALVLPAMPFGPTPEHRGFGSGYIHLEQSLHERVTEAVLESLIEQGFRRLVLWTGCGQHALEKPVTTLNARYAGLARVFLPVQPYHTIWCRLADPRIPGGHADSYATSISLFRRPACVRVDRIPEPEKQDVSWDDPALDLTRHSSTGVIGDATHASAELGERLWQAVVAEVASVLRTAAETPID
jgi:creatinine amidohydrolase